MTTKISPRDWEAISAYLDGQLNQKERNRLEERFRVNTELRTALQEMRRTRAMLRSQPRLRAPRNFTLTPEMIGQRAAVGRPAARLYPGLRLASALASFLFVLVLLGDLLIGGSGRSTAPVQREEPVIAMQAPAPSEEGTAPEINTFALPESESPAGGAEESAPMESQEEFEAMTAPSPAEGSMKKFAAETPTPTVGAAQRAQAPEPTRVPVDAGGVETTEEDASAFSMMVDETPVAEPTSLAEASPVVEEETLPEVDIQEGPAEVLQDESVPPPESSPGLTSWRLAEIGLALVAILTGLLALYLRFARRL